MINTHDLLFVATLAGVCAVALGIVTVAKARMHMEIRPLREILKLVLFFYMAVLLLLTVRPSFLFRPFQFELSSVSLIPFVTISSYFRHAVDQSLNLRTIVNNVFGNVLLFLPMGLLMPVIWPAFRKFWKCLIFCALFSVGIELVQLVFTCFGAMYRTTDIDDVILNTLGGVAGYGLYALGRRHGRRLPL